MATDCIVCEEWCPTSPKAVYLRPAEVTDAEGNVKQVKQPYLDPSRCVGCGACEHACPVQDRPAVYVTSVGESRSRRQSDPAESGQGETEVTSIDLAKRSKDSGFGVWVRTEISGNPVERRAGEFSPGGATELSPALQRWGSGANDSSPGGTTESSRALFSQRQHSFGGLKARRVLLVILGVALVLGASCKRQPGSERSFFPASNQVAGWEKTGEIRTFEAADLWKYVDGDAERYLKAGVQRVSTADYKFQNKVDAVVDIYIMGNAEGAEKIFNSEPVVDGKPIQLGDGARLHSQSLIFRKEAFLVRVVAYEESAETPQALLQLGQGIELQLAR